MTAEQDARDMLERMDVPGAQGMTAGDVVELANLLRNYRNARREGLEQAAKVCELAYAHWMQDAMVDEAGAVLSCAKMIRALISPASSTEG